jgi:hypothetical protein
MENGVMPWGFVLLVLLHGARWLREKCFSGSLRWRSSSGGGSIKILLNKCCGSLDLAEVDESLPPVDHRGDDRRGKWWISLRPRSGMQGILAASMDNFWSSSSAAYPRQQMAVRLLNSMAVRRLLPDLLLALCWYQLVSSLQADVPSWRVFCNSVVATDANPSPSGAVPGDGVGGRDIELVFVNGGKGPDGVFQFSFRVLYVKVEDGVISLFFLGVLYVCCKPTTPN